MHILNVTLEEHNIGQLMAKKIQKPNLRSKKKVKLGNTTKIKKNFFFFLIKYLNTT